MIESSPIQGAGPEHSAQHRWVTANGIRLHVAEAGPREAQPIVFLHGFPENWYSWRNQMRALSSRFRVIAPDLRGFGLSDAPRTGYDLDTVAADLEGLLQALGIEKAFWVGHDWGAIALWRFAFSRPRRCRRLAFLNTPYLLSYDWRGSGMAGLAAALRFSYFAFFQIPKIPEALLGRDPERSLRLGYRATSWHGRAKLSRADLHYLGNLYSRPGAWRGPLSYYRATRESMAQAASDRGKRLDVPTLLLLGRDDPILRPKLAAPMREMVGDLTVHEIARCGHWPQIERPGEVNRALLHFFQG